MSADLASILTDVTPDQADFLKKVFEGWSAHDLSMFNNLTEHEREIFFEILRDLRDDGAIDSSWMWQLDYKEKPVSPEEFLTHPYYYGNQYETIWPAWRSEIVKVLNPANGIKEHVITGAQGIGKSSIAIIELGYKVYHLSVLRNPQLFYGLQEGSMICIGLFNTTLDRTDLTLHYKFKTFLKQIPYFRDRFPYVRRVYKKQEDFQIELPRDIRIVSGSNALHAMSLDMYGGILDEQNFRDGKKVKKYKETDAYSLYSEMSKRIDQRFKNAPALLVNISSAKATSDYIQEHIERVQTSSRVHVTSFALWEALSHKYVDSKWFRVAVGNRHKSSVVLKETEPDPEEQEIVRVPEEHRFHFELDADAALRDLAGKPMVGKTRFIPAREKIFEAAQRGERIGLKHPFTKTEFTLSLYDSIKMEDYFIPSLVFEQVGRFIRFKRYPDSRRFIHVDLSLGAEDAVGFGMGHTAGSMSIETFDSLTHRRIEVFLPVIEMDMMVKIVPAPQGQIDHEKIVNFILYLKLVFGVDIGRASFDGYQSAYSMQMLEKNGITTKLVSTVKSNKPYDMLKQSIITGRFISYPYEPFETEMANLVKDAATGEVDHMPGGAKDISDCVAAVVEGCMTDKGINSVSSLVLPNSEPQRVPDGKLEAERPRDSWVIQDYNTARQQASKILRYSTR